MTENPEILLLVMDADEDRRAGMAGTLAAADFRVMQAADNGAAIRVVEDHAPDVALFTYDLRPGTGFELARHIQTHGRQTVLVMIADSPTTDLLIEAGKYDIKLVMGTPVDPVRLVETVRRVLRAQNKLGHVVLRPVPLGPDELLRRAIVLAQQNARSGMGGPFGAVVADAQGHVLGEGVNSVHTRSDPTAQAEVLAIRRATEVLNRTDLSGCTIYCSAEPAMLGEALIISTGISAVVYALSHEDVGMTRTVEAGIRAEMAKSPADRIVPHRQAGRAEALAMYRAAQAAAGKG